MLEILQKFVIFETEYYEILHVFEFNMSSYSKCPCHNPYCYSKTI